MFLAADDYEALASGTITFSPVQMLHTVFITIVDDNVLENMEQFTVEVVVTEGQERVDVGDAANVLISNDDCEQIPMSTTAMCSLTESLCVFIYFSSCEHWLFIRGVCDH